MPLQSAPVRTLTDVVLPSAYCDTQLHAALAVIFPLLIKQKNLLCLLGFERVLEFVKQSL